MEKLEKRVKKECVKVVVDRKKETVTYSALVRVDGRTLLLTNTMILSYQEQALKPGSPENHVTHPTFEHAFYWPEEFYTQKVKHHHTYQRFLDTNFYYQPNKHYEVHWKEIGVHRDERNKNAIWIFIDGKSWPHAVPPNGFQGVRYDYITIDGKYVYDAQPGEYDPREAIEIQIEGKHSSKILSPAYPELKDPKQRTRIRESFCFHSGKQMPCYVPELYSNNCWNPILNPGEYILKYGNNPLDVCKKCTGTGFNCYLNDKMELIYDQKSKCKECKGMGLRKIEETKDNLHIAEGIATRALTKLLDAERMINKYSK